MDEPLNISDMPEDYWVWFFTDFGEARLTPLGVCEDFDDAEEKATGKFNPNHFSYIFSRQAMEEFCDRFDAAVTGVQDKDFVSFTPAGDFQTVVALDIISALDTESQHITTKLRFTEIVGLMRAELRPKEADDPDELHHSMPFPGAPGS